MKLMSEITKELALKVAGVPTGFILALISLVPADAVSIQFSTTFNGGDHVLTRTSNSLYVWSQPCGGTNLAKFGNNTGGQVNEGPKVMSCFGGTYTWYKVRFYNGVTGWVAGEFLVNNYNNLQIGGQAQVRTNPNNKLWVWSKPCGGTNLAQLGGQNVGIKDKGVVATCFGGTWNWYKVEYTVGREGWVAGEFLQRW